MRIVCGNQDDIKLHEKMKICFFCAILMTLQMTFVQGLSNVGNQYVAANNLFTFDIFKAVGDEYDGENIFMSPYSIMTALAMTMEGAKSNTEKQMLSTLNLDKMNRNDIPMSYKDTNDEIGRDSSAYTLDVANRLFTQESYTILHAFLNVTQKYFDAKAENVDFAESEKARGIINNWVEEQTNQKIKNLIPMGVLNDMTRLVLVNAIYFKADWKVKFDKQLTTKADFYITDEKKVQVDMMTVDSVFNHGYYQEFKCNILELPYTNKEFSMFIILPDTTGSLAELESKLTADKIKAMKDVMSESKIPIHLPSFKITEDFGLRKILSKMGMEDLFVENVADFSKIDGTKNLYVKDVVHKAHINVNEEGTEAAGATGVIISPVSLPMPFSVNRPFILFIQDNKSGAIIVIGRVVDPSPAPEGEMSRIARLYKDDASSAALLRGNLQMLLGILLLVLIKKYI